MLLDLHRIDDALYVQPLKVWQRHSPTMFFPHLLSGGRALSITSSAATTQLFASLARRVDQPEVWQGVVDEAWAALEGGDEEQQTARQTLLEVLVGARGRMAELSRASLRLVDLLAVASRLIGTGRIGGKSLGVLVARAILEQDGAESFAGRLEPHDSFFIGSDVFVNFLVVNGWWRDWTAHRQDDGTAAARLHDAIPDGEFPRGVREDFLQLLEHFGQAPIIVRSSSLLEDDYGNAFAGKYDSVFCVNQGTPQQRLAAFEDAVRTVYASAVGPQALQYRADRGLLDLDEQMAILVQRVSGDLHGEPVLPARRRGGQLVQPVRVGRLAVRSAGMARLVTGLGTRAVDRTGARQRPDRQPGRSVVLARRPRRAGPLDAAPGGRAGPGRRRAPDAADGRGPRSAVTAAGLGAGGPSRRGSRPSAARAGPRGTGARGGGLRARCCADTDVPELLRAMLATLAAAYRHPVDIEFTVNPERDGSRCSTWCSAVRCRPAGSAARSGCPSWFRSAAWPASRGNFMGGNVRLPIDQVVWVRPDAYLRLGQPDRYAVARRIGELNRALDGAALLIGPGRWGTSMPSLGVPTHFTDLNRFVGLVETTYAAAGSGPNCPTAATSSRNWSSRVSSTRRCSTTVPTWCSDPSGCWSGPTSTRSAPRTTHWTQ